MKLKMTFKTTPQMKASGALYIAYYFTLNEQLCFKGHLEIDKDQDIEMAINDKTALKMVDKKEFELKMKKRKRIFAKETAD